MKNGSRIVIIILLLGTLGSGLTFWNYSQHVFSSNHARLIDQAGNIEAFFSRRVLEKVEPRQGARVSIGKNFFIAEVVSSMSTNEGVMVKLYPVDKDNFLKIQASVNDACAVTIDTTIPCDSQ